MNTENNKHEEANKFWLYSPIMVVALALIIIGVTNGPGLDGAARSTTVVFWFLPMIIWAGYKSFVQINLISIKARYKFLLICIWFIPSLPIGLMSLFGILLISETGFGILF